MPPLFPKILFPMICSRCRQPIRRSKIHLPEPGKAKVAKPLLRSSGFWRGVACAGFCFGVLALANADLKVVTQMQISTNGDYRPLSFGTVYYKGDWIRIDSPGQTMLIDVAEHKTIALDHKHKTYF